MEWSNEACIELIHEYELKPVLWNPSHEYYFSKTKKQEVWEEIAKNINKDIEEVKKNTQFASIFSKRKVQSLENYGNR